MRISEESATPSPKTTLTHQYCEIHLGFQIQPQTPFECFECHVDLLQIQPPGTNMRVKERCEDVVEGENCKRIFVCRSNSILDLLTESYSVYQGSILHHLSKTYSVICKSLHSYVFTIRTVYMFHTAATKCFNVFHVVTI